MGWSDLKNEALAALSEADASEWGKRSSPSRSRRWPHEARPWALGLAALLLFAPLAWLSVAAVASMESSSPIEMQILGVALLMGASLGAAGLGGRVVADGMEAGWALRSPRRGLRALARSGRIQMDSVAGWVVESLAVLLAMLVLPACVLAAVAALVIQEMRLPGARAAAAWARAVAARALGNKEAKEGGARASGWLSEKIWPAASAVIPGQRRAREFGAAAAWVEARRALGAGDARGAAQAWLQAPFDPGWLARAKGGGVEPFYQALERAAKEEGGGVCLWEMDEVCQAMRAASERAELEAGVGGERPRGRAARL